MSRLIDADALSRWIKAQCNPYGKPMLNYETSIKILGFIDRMADADVEPKRKWISVAERLPKEHPCPEDEAAVVAEDGKALCSDLVLVSLEGWNGRLSVETDFTFNGSWYTYGDYDVIAWMPLPEPLEVEG